VIASFFPPGADGVSIGAGHAIGDRERKRLGNLQRLLFAIDGARNNADIKSLEVVESFFIAG
jgi:hypothetical protein